MKKILLSVLAMGVIQSGLMAANSGDINISAVVPAVAAIQTSTVQTSTITGLGNQVYTKEKVGEIILDSNDVDGFTLTYSSNTSGYLAKDGSSTDDDKRISYKVSLTRGTGGVLASGVSISGDTDASPDGGTVVFSGSSLTPTYECVYDVGVTTAIKGLVQGSYSDVLTVTIANN